MLERRSGGGGARGEVRGGVRRVEGRGGGVGDWESSMRGIILYILTLA